MGVVGGDRSAVEPEVGDGREFGRGQEGGRLTAEAGRGDECVSRIGGGLRYKGWSWADYANTLKVPGALLADAGIRYEKDGLNVALNVTNLFDKRYVSGCQGVNTCGYGDTLTVMLKIGKEW